MITMLKYTRKNMNFRQDTKHTNTENKSGYFGGGSSVTVISVRRTIVITDIRNCKEKKEVLFSDIS